MNRYFDILSKIDIAIPNRRNFQLATVDVRSSRHTEIDFRKPFNLKNLRHMKLLTRWDF